MTSFLQTFRRRAITVTTIVMGLLLPLSTGWAADEYMPVPDKDPTTIAANPFIAGAYGFIWVAILVYVISIARGLGRANAEIAELKRKLGS
jgi:CcmD family protein